MQAATEKIRDVPAGAECHVAQFGYDEAQTQTRSTGRVRGEALRYMRHRKPRLQRGYEREQETGKQCKAVPTLRNCQFPLSRKPTVSCLLRLRPNPRRTQKLCSGTQDKSCGYAIFQIAGCRQLNAAPPLSLSAHSVPPVLLPAPKCGQYSPWRSAAPSYPRGLSGTRRMPLFSLSSARRIRPANS